MRNATRCRAHAPESTLPTTATRRPCDTSDRSRSAPYVAMARSRSAASSGVAGMADMAGAGGDTQQLQDTHAHTHTQRDVMTRTRALVQPRGVHTPWRGRRRIWSDPTVPPRQAPPRFKHNAPSATPRPAAPLIASRSCLRWWRAGGQEREGEGHTHSEGVTARDRLR